MNRPFEMPFEGKPYISDRGTRSFPSAGAGALAIVNPRTVEELFETDPDDPTGERRVADPALEALHHGLERANHVLGRLVVARAAMMADETMTEGARSLKVREAALVAGERAAKLLNSARDQAIAAADDIKAETKPEPPADAALAAEIRAALRAMPERERVGALDKADAAIISSILAGPEMLSGVSHSRAELAYRLRHHPGELERLHRIDEALARVELAAEATVGFVKEVSTSSAARSAEDARARAAAASEELAAAGQEG